jgi:hypothetical protein
MESFLRGFKIGVLVYLLVTVIGHCIFVVGRFVILRWQVTLVLLAIALYADIDLQGLAEGLAEWTEMLFFLAYCAAWALFRVNRELGVFAFIAVACIVGFVHTVEGSLLPSG